MTSSTLIPALAAGPPGTTFEYSNLGYGILGRAISNASGQEYRDFVRDRLLVPLGMTSTAFDADEIPDDRLAHGYVRLGDRLVREGTDPYGALAAMGGLFTSVRDLATWIWGFMDAFPARDDPEDRHPLRRATRREQQQLHRVALPSVPAHPAHAPAEPSVVGYGYGLAVRLDLALGTIVAHGGGYPGFGSFMAWHPASGVGVVGLGNVRYAPMRDVVMDQLRSLVASGAVPRRRRAAPDPTEDGVMHDVPRSGPELDGSHPLVLGELRRNHEIAELIGTGRRHGVAHRHFQNQIRLAEMPAVGELGQFGHLGAIAPGHA